MTTTANLPRFRAYPTGGRLLGAGDSIDAMPRDVRDGGHVETRGGVRAAWCRVHAQWESAAPCEASSAWWV